MPVSLYGLSVKEVLTVQATSTSAEHVMSLLENVVTKKRTMLTDENVKMLTYLLLNY